MKIKAIIVSALILCCLSATIMYTTAAQSKNESKMITEAIQGKNTPQLIKALISPDERATRSERGRLSCAY